MFSSDFKNPYRADELFSGSDIYHFMWLFSKQSLNLSIQLEPGYTSINTNRVKMSKSQVGNWKSGQQTKTNKFTHTNLQDLVTQQPPTIQSTHLGV